MGSYMPVPTQYVSNWSKLLDSILLLYHVTDHLSLFSAMLPGGYGQNLAGSSPTASLEQHVSEFWYNDELRSFDP